VNYRHAFHAGNFADVFKHAILARILVYLTRKDAPLRFIDTHAGTGGYDLAGAEAERTGEWRAGVGRLLAAVAANESGRTPDLRPPPAPVAALLEPYLAGLPAEPPAAMAQEPHAGPPGSGQGSVAAPFYPGSPMLAARLLRPRDRMIFCELHPDDSRLLAARMRRDRRARTVEIDGYTALRAYIPPVERRGLVFIDPPFERPDELSALARALAAAWRRWPTGVYCVWLPVKDAAQVDDFHAALARAGVRDLLRLDLAVQAPAAGGPLTANCLAIVNPPWVLADEARQLLPYLCDLLAQGPGAGWRVEQVAGEGARA